MEWEASTPEDLYAIAPHFLKELKGCKRVAFYGEMGVGKTTFIKAICKLLDVTDNVSSPTFSLVNEYHTARGEVVFHFDFYRINSVSEVYDMGYEEYFYSGHLCLMEWPEKIEELLDEEVVKIHISQNNGLRKILMHHP